MRVVASFQVNYDDLKRVLEGLERFFQARSHWDVSGKWLLSITALKELQESPVEKEIRLNHARSRIVFSGILAPLERVLLFEIGPAARCDDILKLRSVELRWPDLELVDFRVRHHALVHREALCFLGEFLTLLCPAVIAERRQEDLKGSEPLLAIDNLALFNVCRGCLLLVEDHGAEEMDRCVFSAFQIL